MSLQAIQYGSQALQALTLGLSLGSAFNTVVAVGGAALAAALCGYPKAPRYRTVWAVSALLLAWLIGDGFRVMARGMDLSDGTGRLLGSGAPVWMEWQLIVVWGLVTLGIGYALPAWMGAYVGRRVVHGTGWLSAIVVSASVVYGLSIIGEPAGRVLANLASMR